MRTLLLPLLLLWAAGIAAGADRTYKLPCDIDAFSPSGDGTAVWIACFEPTKTPPQSNYLRRSIVYALDTASGRLTELARATGAIRTEAAPVGTKAVIVLPEDRGNGKAVLYDGTRAITTLAIDPSFLGWSADAKQIYFYGGSTIQSDAWDILGVVQVNGLAVSRKKLAAPTEPVYVCPRTGHVFTGVVSVDDAGRLKPNAAVEYDAALHLIGRNSKIPPGGIFRQLPLRLQLRPRRTVRCRGRLSIPPQAAGLVISNSRRTVKPASLSSMHGIPRWMEFSSAPCIARQPRIPLTPICRSSTSSRSISSSQCRTTQDRRCWSATASGG